MQDFLVLLSDFAGTCLKILCTKLQNSQGRYLRAVFDLQHSKTSL